MTEPACSNPRPFLFTAHRLGCKKVEVTGSPDPKHISTSFVERQNFNMRMSMRRFTRLTNAVAIHFMWCNFAKIHQTLRIPPAMTAGETDRVWDAGGHHPATRLVEEPSNKKR